MELNVSLEGADPRTVRLARSNGEASVWIDGRRHRCGLRAVGERFEVSIDDRTEHVWLRSDHDAVHIHAFGRAWRVEVVDPRARAADRAEAGDDVAMAPMPGMVVSVAVAPGDEVAAGQTLLVIESMKMQNEIVALRDGTVDRVLVEPGEGFDRGAVLVALAADAVESEG